MKNRFAAAFDALRGVTDKPSVAPSIWAGYTSDALQLAQVIDCEIESLGEQQQNPERIAATISDRICSWYLPYFDNPFYGGVMTILRLAESLQRRYGMKQRFLICGAAEAGEVQKSLKKAFPGLAGSEVIILDRADKIRSIPPSDYSIATLWTTAYVLLGVKNTGLKFYMMQDFEPAFYPAGSTYAQAELTYKFGFLGICNTKTLKEIYERQYGGSAVLLQPNVDGSVFYPDASERNERAEVKRLFYYARPGTPRNGFELAAAALRKVKDKLGSGVQIVCAGTGWDPQEFGLSGVVESIGLLPYRETGGLYRSCHAGFVMMMTKHPSYLPFELMACGTTVVTNHNDAITWLLKDGENCLSSPPTANCLAETLIYALQKHEDLAALRARASELITHMSNWDESLERVADFMCHPVFPAPLEPLKNRFIALKDFGVTS